MFCSLPSLFLWSVGFSFSPGATQGSTQSFPPLRFTIAAAPFRKSSFSPFSPEEVLLMCSTFFMLLRREPLLLFFDVPLFPSHMISSGAIVFLGGFIFPASGFPPLPFSVTMPLFHTFLFSPPNFYSGVFPFFFFLQPACCLSLSACRFPLFFSSCAKVFGAFPGFPHSQ